MGKPKNIYKAKSLSVSVFENQTNDKSYKSFKIQRAYKVEGSDEYKYTDSLRQEDIAVLNSLLQTVFDKEIVSNKKLE
jgi:hypothetical protein